MNDFEEFKKALNRLFNGGNTEFYPVISEEDGLRHPAAMVYKNADVSGSQSKEAYTVIIDWDVVDRLTASRAKTTPPSVVPSAFAHRIDYDLFMLDPENTTTNYEQFRSCTHDAIKTQEERLNNLESALETQSQINSRLADAINELASAFDEGE